MDQLFPRNWRPGSPKDCQGAAKTSEGCCIFDGMENANAAYLFSSDSRYGEFNDHDQVPSLTRVQHVGFVFIEQKCRNDRLEIPHSVSSYLEQTLTTRKFPIFQIIVHSHEHADGKWMYRKLDPIRTIQFSCIVFIGEPEIRLELHYRLTFIQSSFI